MNTDHPAAAALVAVLHDASEQLHLPVTEITVRSLEAHDWPDGCLGLPGNGCPDVITPGFRIVLGSPGDGFAYRTDQRGTARREPASATVQGDLQVHVSRSGGLIGRTSEVDLNTATMPAAEAEELKRLVEEADFWNLPQQIGNGEPIEDGYSYSITVAAERGHHSVGTYDGTQNGLAQYPGFGAMLGWLAARTPSSMSLPDL